MSDDKGERADIWTAIVKGLPWTAIALRDFKDVVADVDPRRLEAFANAILQAGIELGRRSTTDIGRDEKIRSIAFDLGKRAGASEENEACERAMGDVMADFIDDAGDALIYRREAIEAIRARRKQP